MSKHKPIIYLAFANDRTGQYLEKLKEERIFIQNALRKAVESGWCEIVIAPDATFDDIYRDFTASDYRNRIAAFHYAGHAGHEGIHVENEKGRNEMAYSSGLAQLFKTQENLKLVFLNGCSTQKQVEDLQAIDVPNVIATNRSIADDVAVLFAKYFYESLGQQFNVFTSFNNAEAAIKARKDKDNFVDRKRAVRLKRLNPLPELPWKLYTKDTENSWRLNTPFITEQPNMKVFVAYAKEDTTYQTELAKHLYQLEREKLITAFNMLEIGAGLDKLKVIKENLFNAQIIILLISPDFMFSRKCEKIEQVAMERHDNQLATVLPILIRKVDLGNRSFNRLSFLPDENTFVTDYSNKDEAFTDISKAIRGVVKRLIGHKEEPSTNSLWGDIDW